MNFFRAQNEAGLTDIRMAYLLEDFPEMSAEQAEHIRAGLPKYYAEHLERDFFEYIAEEGGKAVGSAFLARTLSGKRRYCAKHGTLYQ